MTCIVVLAPAATASFAAIGTTATVVVSDRSAVGTAVSMLRDDIDALDLACSRFRADSEIRAVERAGTATGVGQTLATQIAASLRAADLTDGLLDPTVGSCLEALGYDRDFGQVADADDAVRPVPAPGWRSVDWNPRARTLRVPPGVRMDLGSTAKALAADLAAARIAGAIDGGVLVDLGGDIAVAGPAPDAGWRVRIGEAPDRPGPIIAIRSGGLATSGTTRRRWRRGGDLVHHLVDPATGRPGTGPWTAATVAAGSCLDANIASTAALLLGVGAPSWLEGGRLPARLVDTDGRARTIGDWPPEAVEG